MATFSVMIENKNNAEYAFNFINALLAKDHNLNMLFCFKDGIYAVINAKGVLDDRWQKLLQNYKIKLSLCSTSITKAQLEESIAQNPNLELVGLTSFVLASKNSDRHIQF